MGALLGDGGFRSGQPSFTSEDQFILDEVQRRLPDGDELVRSSRNAKRYDYRINGGKVKEAVKGLGLWGHKSVEKFVPKHYLWTTYENRLALLQGLMDTDGSAITAGAAVFNSSSEQLTKDTQFLIQSLGGTASISLRTAPLKQGHNLAYNVHIRLPLGMCPFLLPRKADYFHYTRHQKPLRGIKLIEFVGVEEVQCIRIKDPKGLYITDDFIVTHNSSLYSLRLTVLTGRPELQNVPQDLRDWYAAISEAPGMWVGDNVRFTGKDMRQRLSDELAQPLDALVMTPKGYRTIDDLSLGDKVLDPWGKHARIIEEHPLGTKSVYRVRLSDGSSTECCIDHLWAVQTRDDIGYKPITARVMSLQELMTKPLRYGGKNARLKWYIPGLQDNQIDLTRDDMDYEVHRVITPYVLGAFLGDGNLSSRQLFFAGIEKDLVERVDFELPKGCSLGSSKRGSHYVRGTWKGLQEAFEVLGLRGTLSRTKFVPEKYLFTTAENRLELLRGLMDTDGTVRVACTGTAQFSSLSKDLATAVQFLSQSLGGRSNISQRADGAYQVSVSLPDNIVPFWTSRKRTSYESFQVKPKTGYRSIVNIEHVGEKEVKCITLDTNEGLYLTNDFIITHNCRLTTEPDPHVTLRKLYTTSERARIPINSAFALTSIYPPFQSADLQQRSLVIKFKAIPEGERQSNWLEHQLGRFGGRSNWVLYQLLALRDFFRVVKTDWDDSYKSYNRLANYEQAVILMARVLGLKAVTQDVLRRLAYNAPEGGDDATMEGLKEFAQDKKPGELFAAGEIVDWAENQEDYKQDSVLISSRKIGRYIRAHEYDVQKYAKIVPKRGANRTLYFVERQKPEMG